MPRLKISHKKNGDPKALVIRPTGNSAGVIIILHNMSEITIKIEPNKADPISTKLWLTPPKILTKWGTINPTNPIIPDKATLIPTTTAEDIITPKRTFFMFRPNLLASMSPS